MLDVNKKEEILIKIKRLCAINNKYLTDDADNLCLKPDTPLIIMLEHDEIINWLMGEGVMDSEEHIIINQEVI